jgi:hypothetical protein
MYIIHGGVSVEQNKILQVVYDEIYEIIWKIERDFKNQITKEEIKNELEKITQNMINMHNKNGS